MTDLARSIAGDSPLKIFVSAGEPSGDRQAAYLLDILRQLRPEIEICGIGSTNLAAIGADLWMDSRKGAVIGLAAALLSAPVVVPQVLRVMKRLEKEKPEVAVLVDWGGVNVRLARLLRRLRVPTLYYFPPRSWDRRAHRDIAFICDAIATPFPWSKHILSGETARVEWVGHPLVDQVQPKISKTQAASELGLDLSRPIVALLPGSRKAEIRHSFPVLVASAVNINRQIPGTQFLITASEEALRIKGKLSALLQRYSLEARLLQGMDYDALQCADAAAAVSGTVTLELALLGIPMVVIYRGSLAVWLQYQIARRTTAVTRFIAMPNLIADRQIVPECLQWQANPGRIATEIISLLTDRARREKMLDDLASASRQLGPPGAAHRTAEMVLDLVAYGSHQQLLQPMGAEAEG